LKSPYRAIIRREVDAWTMPGETKTVIVGQSKPLLNYVIACITMFNSGAEHVILRSRGEAINMAVDVVQVLKKRFVSTVQISKIQIDGEDVFSRDGRQLSLPVLEIELSVPKPNSA
jgi:archaea-specific DNA-binding protein